MCGVKMFCSSRANHTTTNFKKFLSWKLDKFTLFTHSLVGWNLENLYKPAVPFFIAYGDILSEKNPFLESLFIAKQELITRSLSFAYKTSQLARISLLISDLNKEFFFFVGKLFNKRWAPDKSNWKLLSCVCIAWYKHSRGWENSWQLCEPETTSRVWFLVFISGYANKGKKFSIA